MTSRPVVTQRLFTLDENATLMSTTDPLSYITHANDTFVHASGYSVQELVGEPHNLVRHPDMPKAAFADMWFTLKQGEPWSGIVKNLRKDGDHYWVRANAVPMMRNGKLTGYMSIRSQASTEEIAAVEPLYQALNQGTARHRLFKGLVLRKGIIGRLPLLPLRWRIRSAMAALFALQLGGQCMLGSSGAELGLSALVTAGTTLLATWLLEHHIARPIEDVARQALKVATGERTSVNHLNRADEVGLILRAVGQLGLMCRWLLNDITLQVANVRSGSETLVKGSEALNQHTHQTVANAQRTVATMNDMTASVQANSETAAAANTLSGTARAAAEQGGQAMDAVVKTMDEIADSTRHIGCITKLINDIAFQTNILALNAAVEAARAGEQGKGFAVVAAEVRNLANRSASAADDIRRLIDTSAEKVQSGAVQVHEAGRTMQDIVAQVQNVTELIGQISRATSGQAQGLSELNRAVAELDDITRKNASLVEESTSVSAMVRSRAGRLEEAVAVLR